MDQKSIIVEDPYNLSKETLINEYQNLCKYYNELKHSDQRQLQEIHQLRRELQTALNDKNHLSSELEIINSDHSKEIEIIQEKHRDELNDYKNSLSVCKDDLETVESERDNLERMLEDVKRLYEEKKQNCTDIPVDNNQSSVYIEKVTELETENDALAEVVESLKQELTEALKSNLQFEVCLIFLSLN